MAVAQIERVEAQHIPLDFPKVQASDLLTRWEDNRQVRFSLTDQIEDLKLKLKAAEKQGALIEMELAHMVRRAQEGTPLWERDDFKDDGGI